MIHDKKKIQLSLKVWEQPFRPNFFGYRLTTHWLEGKKWKIISKLSFSWYLYLLQSLWPCVGYGAHSQSRSHHPTSNMHGRVYMWRFFLSPHFALSVTLLEVNLAVAAVVHIGDKWISSGDMASIFLLSVLDYEIFTLWRSNITAFFPSSALTVFVINSCFPWLTCSMSGC